MALKVDPPRRILGAGVPVPKLRGYNPVDIIALVYLGVITTLLIIRWGRLPSYYLVIHLVLLAGVALLRLVPHLGRFPLQFIRESYPLWCMPLAYSELDVINRLVGSRYFDDRVLWWDRVVFGGHPHLHLHEWLPVPLLSEFLHLCYLLYILLVPLLGFTLYLQRRTEAFRVFATTVCLNMYACYLVFIFFPVQGPFYAAEQGQPGGFFSAIVREHLLRGAARGTAFPSSHVSGAIAVAVMAYWFSRRLSYLLIGMAGGIALATVYGGFHYAIDALAGVALGLSMAFIGPRLHAALLRRHRLPHIPLRFPHIHVKGGRLRRRSLHIE